MKLLKLVFVCLIALIGNNLFAQSEDANTESINCSGNPELFIIEVTDQHVVHYLWSYEGEPSFYVLEYRGIDGCIILNFSEETEILDEPIEFEPSGVFGSDFGCPPDVWTIIPGPTLKTSSSNSASFEKKSGFATAFFKSCVNFEFRMKVVCNNDTLYSNIVPYFYDDGACPDCMPERTITGNHDTDITIQAENRIASNVVVEANVTYKAGERIVLNNGFSSKPGFNFKVMTEICSEP